MGSFISISPDQLPDAEIPAMDFLDSTFFKIHPSGQRLPSPAEVRSLSSDAETSPQPLPVVFKDLGLLVKFGPHVPVSEALCLRALKKALGEKFPVPEVYGWRVDEKHGQVFVYMEFIRGQTLKERWDFLDDDEKAIVCSELHRIMGSIRSLEQKPSDPFIGSITRSALLDLVFEFMPGAGPFSSVKAFNDWFDWLPQRFLPESRRYEEPRGALLPDTAAVTFTHGDLHGGNIMLSLSNSPQVLAIVDWAQAGWYPDYWEYCKVGHTSHHAGEWRNKWVPMFLEPREDELYAFAEYVASIGSI